MWLSGLSIQGIFDQFASLIIAVVCHIAVALKILTIS